MKKLKNEQGMTILMTLLLVLTAAVVSAVILSAALSAARRVNSDRTAQQNYLAVSSAAELVRDSVRTQKYVKTVTTETKVVKDEATGEERTEVEVKTEEHCPTGLMGAWLTEGARKNGCTDTVTITLPDEALPSVKAEFSMTGRGTGSKGYDIRIAFSLVDAEDADDCRMTLRLSGKYSYELDSGYSDKTVETTTIRWEYPAITKGTEEST